MITEDIRPLNTIGDVLRSLEAIGLPVEERTARTWRAERIGLRLEGGEVGRYQLYAARDVVRMAVMAALVKAGVSAGFAAKAVNETLMFWDRQAEFYVVTVTSPEGTSSRSVNSKEDILALLDPPDDAKGFLNIYPPVSLHVIPVHRLAAMLGKGPS